MGEAGTLMVRGWGGGEIKTETILEGTMKAGKP